MGLKTYNYEIAGNIYPTVYAVWNGTITHIASPFMVGFNIQTTRDNAIEKEPLKVVWVPVENWDRKSDIVKVAYQLGKEKQVIYVEMKKHI